MEVRKMRLTLRTLLAYLDGILEPDDAQALGKKIDESEYAAGLVHRLRDVMRRLRLGAPSLTDRGPGLDPNTVAEYLDNTLPAERVTDFEKVCLDSDTHLAEVGSCHQILTLVLGEPAEVDPASRQRMYELQDVHAGSKPPPTPVAAPVGAPPVVEPVSLDLGLDAGSGDRRSRPKATVPEYLREPRRRRAWLPTAAAVLLVACIIVIVLKVVGQLEPGTPVGDALVRSGLIAAAPVKQEVAVKGSPEQGATTDGNENQEGGKEVKIEKAPPLIETTPGANSKESEARPGASPAGKSGPEVKQPDKVTPEPVTVAVPNKDNGKTPSTPPPTKNNLPEPGAGTAADQKTPVPDEAKGTAKSAEESKTPPEKNDKKKGTDSPPEVAPGPEPLGRLLSGDQVLLGNDRPESGWTRVGPTQMLIPQHVIALPTYRAKVVLTLGVTLDILGGSRVELLGSSPQEMPGIRVVYGRVVLMPLGKANTKVRVAFGDHSGTISFADANSIAAIDVHNLHEPGVNPEDVPPRVTAELFVASGSIVWEEAVKDKEKGKEEKALPLAPPQRLWFDGQAPASAVAAKTAPDWITRVEPLGQLDVWASSVVAKALATDKPARVTLLELITGPRPPKKEVASLVLRCLGYVGQFSDMAKALNNPNRKTEWGDYYVPQLRAAVARDAETATAVRVALEKEYPQQSADLYRMLLGYTNEQLKAGDDAMLVRGLKNDESLAVRVLSHWNLKDITGKGLNYYPTDRPVNRVQPVRHWEQRLEAKDIRFPSDLKPRTPRGPVAPPAPAG
jgi:hypothetical protein